MIHGPHIIFIQRYYHLQNCSKGDNMVLCCWRDCATMQLLGLHSAEWDMSSGYVRSEKEACFNTFTQTNNLPKNVQIYTCNHDSLYTVLWYPVLKLLATLRQVYSPELGVITLRQSQCTDFQFIKVSNTAHQMQIFWGMYLTHGLQMMCE
jgi:hypothetical protein